MTNIVFLDLKTIGKVDNLKKSNDILKKELRLIKKDLIEIREELELYKKRQDADKD